MSALVDRPGRRTTVLAVAGLMLALFLVALGQTIVGTALPKIIAELNGFEKYAWVTTAYLLASTSMIPVIGKLGDIYGRKWFIVAGIFVFLVGSALCGAAWGMTELILFRGVQGLGAGMIFANIFTSVADIFPDPARRAKFQGIFFGVFALSSVIGPTLGGWITDNLDWRWVFYVNLPALALAFDETWLLFRPTYPTSQNFAPPDAALWGVGSYSWTQTKPSVSLETFGILSRSKEPVLLPSA